MKELKSLYNAIMNDYSIQYYSLNWKDVVELIEKRFKTPIKKTDESFEDELIYKALGKLNSGKLKNSIESMAKELSINTTTIREKSHRVNQKSPFGIGA